MSQAEELLDSMLVDATAETEQSNSVFTEVEPHIVIGVDRFIIVPAELKRIAVQYDHNMRTVTFDCPRFYDGRDMSEMHVYINIMGANKTRYSYIADNVRVDDVDENIMHFDWTINRPLSDVNGQLAFLVCIRKADSEGNEENHWNSELNKELYISEGMEYEEILESDYPDIVSQLLDRMDEIERNASLEAIQQIKTDVTDLKTAAQTAQTTANSATTAAQTAQTTANTANEKIDDLQDAVTKSHSSTVETVTGELITLEDTYDLKLSGLKLYGKTTQKTTTGKNLFDLGSARSSNCTLEINGDTVRIYTTSAGTYKGLSSSIVRLVAGTTYTISVHLDVYVCGTVRFGMRNGVDNSFILGTSKSGITEIGDHSITFKPTTDIDAYLSILVTWSDSSEIGDATFSNIQIELGSTATDYEPYTGGIPSPNPDYPQPLESIGDGGSVGVTVAGKNLIDPVLFTQENLGTTLNSDVITTTFESGTLHLNRGKEAPIPKGTYTLSIIPVGTGISMYGYFYSKKDPKKVLKYMPVDYRETKFTNTFSMDEDFIFCIAGYAPHGTYSYRIMLEKGETATEYEPYKETQTLSISTPNGLPGIPVASGGNHTDENGQQWICDEVDFEKGKYIQWIGTKIFTGSENWGYGSNEKNPSFFTGLPRLQKNVGDFFCSHFVYKPVPYASPIGTTGIFGWESSFTVVYFAKSDLTTVEEWKSYLSEQNSKGTPVTVIYALREPIETSLSAEQLAQYAALHTNYPNTTIYNDSGVDMEVKYVSPSIALPTAGGPMGGNIDMQGHKLTNIPAPEHSSDAVNKGYVDAYIEAVILGGAW